MPYQVSWFINERIILVELTGIFTKDDLFALSQEAYDMTEAGVAPVHTITDARHMINTEIGPEDLRQISERRSYKSGWTVTVTPGRIDRFLATIATHLFRMNGRHFATFDEAVAFLQEVDGTLPTSMARS